MDAEIYVAGGSIILAVAAGCYRPSRGWRVFWMFYVTSAVAFLLAGMAVMPSLMSPVVYYGLAGMIAEMAVGNGIARRQSAEETESVQN